MTIAEATEKMIRFSEGNVHDIEHFLKVWAYARTIGQQEKLDDHTQMVLELSALVHDIACPLCREKYGNTNGKLQERESAPLVEEFFSHEDIDESDVNRIADIVSRHHTYTGVDGIDLRILLEADFIVNAGEKGYGRAAVLKARELVFETRSGTRILDSIYG